MSDETILLRMSWLEERHNTLQKEVNALEADLKAERTARTDEEKRRLLWGISALGLVVTSLFGVLWNARAFIFKG